LGDRAHVDDDLAGRKPLGNSFRAKENRLDVWSVRDHGDDHLGIPPDLATARARDSALVRKLFRRRATGVCEELVAACEEVAGHGTPHDAETDETDLCHFCFSSVGEIAVQAALSAR
jgi:hypothetical protein